MKQMLEGFLLLLLFPLPSFSYYVTFPAHPDVPCSPFIESSYYFDTESYGYGENGIGGSIPKVRIQDIAFQWAEK